MAWEEGDQGMRFQGLLIPELSTFICISLPFMYLAYHKPYCRGSVGSALHVLENDATIPRGHIVQRAPAHHSLHSPFNGLL